MKNVNDSSAVAYASVPTQHNYNGGVFPEIVVNNESCSTVEETVAFVKANQVELEAKLAKSGALLFRGFPLDSAETFDVFSAGFGYPNFTYQESLSNAVRINYTERVFTANEAPKDGFKIFVPKIIPISGKVEKARLVIGVHRDGGLTEPLELEFNGIKAKTKQSWAADVKNLFAPVVLNVPASKILENNFLKIGNHPGLTITSVHLEIDTEKH